MRTLVHALLAVLLLVPPAGFRATASEPTANAGSQAKPPACPLYATWGGRLYLLSPTRQELDEAPLWSPFSGEEPPVPVGEAIRLAIDEFTRHFEDHDDWFLSGISLMRICGERWSWVIHWQPKRKGDTGSILLPVLMSGVVVPVDRLAPIAEAD